MQWGFLQDFLTWIKECISTSMYLVKINGQLEGFFRGKKGLRPEDPLSPYLFVICMEVLTKLLYKATSEGKIRFHSKCDKLLLSHLCFAHDLLLFSEASLSSLQDIKLVMTEF